MGLLCFGLRVVEVWFGLGWNGIGLGWVGLGLDWVGFGLGWVRNCIGVGLGWVGLRLGSIGLDGVGLGLGSDCSDCDVFGLVCIGSVAQLLGYSVVLVCSIAV